MKVGDYVRTKTGRLGKISNENVDYSSELISVEESCIPIAKRHITKSSPNIIDLIEVGDIITFKDDEDVYKVIGISDKGCSLEVFYLAKNYDGNTEDIMVYPDEMKKYIKSIVTKEQFESMKYEVK